MNITLDLIRETANEAHVPFQQMSKDAQDFMRANGNKHNTQHYEVDEWSSQYVNYPHWYAATAYRLNLADELANPTFKRWEDMSSLARVMLIQFPARLECFWDEWWQHCPDPTWSKEGVYRINMNTQEECKNENLTVFCKMSAFAQADLKLAKAVEILTSTAKWIPVIDPAFNPGDVYRKRPEPPEAEVHGRQAVQA